MNVVVYYLCRRKACLPGPCRPIISGPDFISAACDLMIIRLPLQYRNNMGIIKTDQPVLGGVPKGIASV